MGNARKSLRSGTESAVGGSRRDAALATLESIPAPVVVVDQRQHVTFVNRHVVHRFGFATAELVGHPLSRLVPNEQRGTLWQALTEVLQRKRQTAAGLEGSVVCKGGASCPVSIEAGLLEIGDAAMASRKRNVSRSSAAGPGIRSQTSIGGPTSCTKCCRSTARKLARSSGIFR